MKGKHLVLAEEYQTQHRRQKLVEKNHLYNQMQTHTKPQIDRLTELTRALENTADAEGVRTLTLNIAVITTYLKRRNNLIFIAQDLTAISPYELEYCLKETLNNLSLSGAQCVLNIDLAGTLSFESITRLYDSFEALAEAVFDTLTQMYVSVFEDGENIVLCTNTVCSADLSALGGVCEGENEWTVEFSVPKGGDGA